MRTPTTRQIVMQAEQLVAEAERRGVPIEERDRFEEARDVVRSARAEIDSTSQLAAIPPILWALGYLAALLGVGTCSYEAGSEVGKRIGGGVGDVMTKVVNVALVGVAVWVGFKVLKDLRE
jgi:hypothetical protein